MLVSLHYLLCLLGCKLASPKIQIGIKAGFDIT